MDAQRLSPCADATLLRRLCCGCCLIGGAVMGWAEEPLPAGPELTLTTPHAAGLRTLHDRVLDLQMHPPGRAPEAGRWQFTLQRYGRPWQPDRPPAPDAVAVGVYLNTSSRAQLGWQSRPLGPYDSTATLGGPAPGRPPETMALRSADPLADLRLGALAKFSLGQQTSISLRPRKGGLRLSLQAQW